MSQLDRAFRRIAVGTAIGGACVLVLGVGCYAAGARVNTTKSIPLGLYWTTSKPIEKGAYVMFCPPPAGAFATAKARGYITAGFCPGDYGYLMKKVLAAKDDAIAVTDDGVLVNGSLLPKSVPLKADKGGRPLPRHEPDRYTLGPGELLLMSDVNPASFDSRYFGPVNRSQVTAVIAPVFTW